MTNVFRLVRTSNRDTVAALECLSRHAASGEITGLALCYMTKDGGDEVVFTGAYAAHPDKALSAAVRLSVRLTQAREEDLAAAP